MLKIARVQVFLVDDSEPKSREPDVMVVDILKTIYLMCKI